MKASISPSPLGNSYGIFGYINRAPAKKPQREKCGKTRAKNISYVILSKKATGLLELCVTRCHQSHLTALVPSAVLPLPWATFTAPPGNPFCV